MPPITVSTNKVQRQMCKSAPILDIYQSIQGPSYDLRACKLPTVYFRHIRGDMIETIKIVTGIYNTVVSPNYACSGFIICNKRS